MCYNPAGMFPETIADSDIQTLVKELLEQIGEEPDREGLVKTPQRFEEAIRYLTSGYQKRLEEVVNGAVFNEDYDEMVVVKNVELFSLCEHHLLPFYGKCHVAYIPKGKIIGLSKVPRIIDMYSRRLQVQERLTSQIADSLNKILKPLGVGVVIEAYHLCMAMRGVEKQHAVAMTSSMLGVFRTDRSTRMEFMELIRNSERR